MESEPSLSEGTITEAESSAGVRVGIARLGDILQAPSHQAVSLDDRHQALSLWDGTALMPWPEQPRSVLVLAMHHPASEPALDWWQGNNTEGNRRLRALSESLKGWLRDEHNLGALPLPYHARRGGLFLKDAAVLAGLGIVGRNNLLLTPAWGPQVRLRCMLIQGDLQPTGPLAGFSPCETCDAPCQDACPQGAFQQGVYAREHCTIQMDLDQANARPEGARDEMGRKRLVTKYCRACELACPIGR
jgi:epoxyqueuosine reductase